VLVDFIPGICTILNWILVEDRCDPSQMLLDASERQVMVKSERKNSKIYVHSSSCLKDTSDFRSASDFGSNRRE